MNWTNFAYVALGAFVAGFWGCLLGVWCGMRLMLPTVKALMK